MDENLRNDYFKRNSFLLHFTLNYLMTEDLFQHSAAIS